MKVVVLGGNNEAGSYLVPVLVQEGHEVVSVSNNDRAPFYAAGPEVAELCLPKVERLVLDRQAMDVDEYAKRIAEMKPEAVVDVCSHELNKTQALVKALKTSPDLKLFVHMGTFHVYSTARKRPWTEDDSRPYPIGLYASEQQRIEAMLHKEHMSNGKIFPSVVLLHGGLVGRGWSPLNFQGHYDHVVFRALESGSVMVPDDGKKTGNMPLHMVHAMDFAIAVAMCVKGRGAGVKVERETFNVCPELPISCMGYAKAFVDILEVKRPNIKMREWVDFQEALGDREVAIGAYDAILRYSWASSKKLVERLNFQPMPLVNALADSVLFLRENESELQPHTFPELSTFLRDGDVEYIEAPAFDGPKHGYVFKDGTQGLGYYLDRGYLINYQRRVYAYFDMETARLRYTGGFTHTDIFTYLVLSSITFWGCLYLLYATETAQGLFVYMTWAPYLYSGLTAFPPRPFSSMAKIQSDSGVRLGVWHNLLPRRGSMANYTEEELSAGKETCRTVLYLHGNGEHRGKQAWKLKWYAKELGAHVVAMDYRGFGDSSCPDRAFTGCTSEAGVMHDAYQTYDWLTRPHDQGGIGIPTKCILVHGHSLGTAIASRVAAKLTELGRAPAGVILESPMTSVIDVIKFWTVVKHLPGFIKSRMIALVESGLKHRFEGEKYVADVGSPVLILHGERDMVTDYSFGKAMYEARALKNHARRGGAGVKGNEFVGLPNADHQSVMKQPEAIESVIAFAEGVWGK